MSSVYKIEPITGEHFRSVHHLLVEHYEEVARNKEVMVLAPDWGKYRDLEDAGALLILGAFADGELVGYSVNIVTNHLHYRNLRVCSNDVLFVAKAHRSSPLGLRLMRATEQGAAEQGAGLMLWHAKEGSQLSSILSRKSYSVQDIIYSKQLRAS